MTESASKATSVPVPRRYLALWFPFLPADRMRWEQRSKNSAEPDDRPLVVVEKVKGALRIMAINQRASKLGLISGLTLADARACFPNLAVAEADTQADALFVERLAELCDRYTPSVALDPPHGLLLDITGCAHLFADEKSLRMKVAARMTLVGLAVRASIAGTPDAARALARFSRVDIAPQGQDEVLVRPLPAVALAGLERETVVALSRAGLKTIGDLADRPPQVLAARFGQDLVTSLLRTLGRENRCITPLRPLPTVAVERHFAEPFTQAEALESILSGLIADAAHIMQERDEGGRVFEVSFFRSDGAVRRLVVQTGRPSRDTLSILRLYRERLDTLADPIDPGFGFDAIRLAVLITEALNVLQPHLDGSVNDNDAVSDLVDRLIVRFGPDRVLRFEARDTHDPECEARLVSAAKGASFEPHGARARDVHWPAPELGEPPTRPLQIFTPPQPIETLAEVPDGPPIRFRWRRVLHDIARAEGPERIAPEWWRKASGTEARDYYRIEDTAGCRFWVFRQGGYGDAETQPRWFLHGVFA